MSPSVFNKLHQTLWLVGELQDGLDDLNVFQLLVSAYVIDLSRVALVQNCVYGFTVILNVEPVSNVFSSPVHWYRLFFSRAVLFFFKPSFEVGTVVFVCAYLHEF